MMKATSGYRHLILPLLIFILVLVPAVILTVFAARGIDQEEARIRRQLEGSLRLELEQVNASIRSTLSEILDELRESAPDDLETGDPARVLRQWESADPLVGLAYLLNEDGSIRIPELTADSGENPDSTSLFYWRYLNFFSNNESIPVYRNIAEVYEQEILSSEPRSGFSPVAAAPASDESAKESAKESADELVSDFAGGFGEADSAIAGADTDGFAPASPSAGSPAAMRSARKAANIFESSPELQDRVYEQAAEEGKQSLQRNVLPRLTLPSQSISDKPAVVDARTDPAQARLPEVRSVFIESTRYFQELVSLSDYGLIPRIFDNSFILLYYENRKGVIFGCELDIDGVRSRIAESLGSGSNALRYINILDQGGRPVLSVGEGEGIDEQTWKQPLLAREISEMLPYWETVVLLRDPELLEEEIRDSRYFLGIVIGSLLSAIVAGMLLLFRFSASRLRAVEQRTGFVTNVSHELKTPLTSIRMYSELLAETRDLSEEKRGRYLSHIVSESQRLSRLIGNVLDFAKLEKGTKILNTEAVDLNLLVDEISNSFGDELRREGFKLDIRAAPELPRVHADREAVIQILINLLTNAKKYSRDHKQITLVTGKRDDGVALSVEDRGIGIARRYRRKIFRDFFRIDSRLTADTQGSGLGLSIARRLARAHGGNLIFEPLDSSDHRKGSRFTLVFPLAAIDEPRDIAAGGSRS